MTESQPRACSLEIGDLRDRLEEIAAFGAEHLTSRSADGDRHVLRFRADPASRRRLERIVAAESKCCAFLDLELRDTAAEIVLTISAPSEAAPIAAELALAFGNPGPANR